ncbi:MAG: gamma-glutamylcyclotransferase [Desulfovibrionaceae bacterium]|jgi:hypothetical protein|nr:gamma-glutamylcyclotransferase [Desulfovibrionaceae bacterium]
MRDEAILFAPAPARQGVRPPKKPKIRYFAYGPNMHPDQMRERCLHPVVLGIARLPGYALAFHGHTWLWDGGMETVVPAPGRDLWGVLYELSPTDADSLDAWQDIRLNGTGSYFHSPVEVFAPDGTRSDAVLYRKDILGEPLPPSREFLEHILCGARAHGLPEGYLRELAGIPCVPARYPVPRRRDENREAFLRTTSCPDCSSLLDAGGKLKEGAFEAREE